VEFRLRRPHPSRVTCGIILFNDLLNEAADSGLQVGQHFRAISWSSLLTKGYYADLEIDGHWLEVHVSRNGRVDALDFAQD